MLDASFNILYIYTQIYVCIYKYLKYLTLLEVAFLDFSASESLLESDSDLELEELSSDELDSVSEELPVDLEISFAFFLMSSESLEIKNN